jgi:hypothetical protein
MAHHHGQPQAGAAVLSPPITLDAAIDVVLGMPMCASSDESQRTTGTAYCTAFFADLTAIGKRSDRDRLLAESVRQHVWAASRGFASLRKFFEEHKAYRNRVMGQEEDFVRGFAGLDKLNAAGWTVRIGAGLGSLLAPATIDWMLNRASQSPPIDAASMKAVVEAAAARSAIASASPLPSNLVNQMDGMIFAAANRSMAPGPLAPMADALLSPRTLGLTGLGVIVLLVVLTGMDWYLRGRAQRRLREIETRTTIETDADWVQTRERYCEVLTSFIRSVVRALEQYEQGQGASNVAAILGRPLDLPIDWNSKRVDEAFAEVANRKMRVYPPHLGKVEDAPQA